MEENNSVVLVDEYGCDLFNKDGSLFTMEKIEAHRRGLLHRAISVFIFNNRDELLIQKRAADKYHSPKMWSNTCCTHPHPGESPLATAQRRLFEEMGLVATLTEAFTFLYRAVVGNDLIENEYDHIFIGVSNQCPQHDPAEVADWKWVTLEDLWDELNRNPQNYSPWLRKCFGDVIKYKLQERG